MQKQTGTLLSQKEIRKKGIIEQRNKMRERERERKEEREREKRKKK